MKNSPLAGLVIRTAVVRSPDVGYIYAADPKLEREEIPHAITFKWNAGTFVQGKCNYDAHSACRIETPEFTLVNISGAGYYSVIAASARTSGEIVEDSHPPSKTRRIGRFR